VHGETPLREAVLVLEGDRSSVRFDVFARDAAGVAGCVLRGGLTHLYGRARFRACDARGAVLDDIDCADEIAPGHAIAIDFLLNWLALHAADLTLRAVGHRLGDDGGLFAGCVRMDAAARARLDSLATLDRAERAGLSLLRLLERRMPALPQVVCFDSTFHAAIPAVARAFDALTRPAPCAGHRHGLAYEDLVAQLTDLDPHAARGRVVAVHLHHATVALCAIAAGRGMAATPDFRRRVRLGDDARRGRRPVRPGGGDILRHRIGREIGSLVAVLGGLDAVAFAVEGTMVGAHLSRGVLRDMAWLGIEVDPRPRTRGGSRLTHPTSPVAAYLVTVDPARTVARHTFELIEP
jgi:acetate kinase